MSARAIEVLVVDDDYRVADIHAALVARVPGYEVVGTAHTAEEAMALTRDLRPQLVLMDVYLPDGNGLDVVRALLAEPEPPAVIVISAARELATVKQAMQLGAVHYLVKPFGFKVLAERLIAFQRMRRHLAGLGDEPEQGEVDELFGMLRLPPSAPGRAADGHSAPTLDLVRKAVAAGAAAAMSASEVAGVVGISRATAQRYLSYLQRQGVVDLELKYGATGRPEHRYRLRLRR